MDGLANFKMLRERLQTIGNQTAFLELEMIRMNALEEFRKLTQGQILTLDGITYDAVKRHSMSVEKKNGWCFRSVGSA